MGDWRRAAVETNRDRMTLAGALVPACEVKPTEEGADGESGE